MEQAKPSHPQSVNTRLTEAWEITRPFHCVCVVLQSSHVLSRTQLRPSHPPPRTVYFRDQRRKEYDTGQAKTGYKNARKIQHQILLRYYEG